MKSFPEEDKACLSCITNNMVAVDLAMQGAKASAVMVMTQSSEDIRVSTR